MMFSLKGKIAVVTGGCGLLGNAIANALAESGAKVIILDIKKNKNRHNSENIVFENFDVTRLDKVKTAIEKLEKKYGKHSDQIKKIFETLSLLALDEPKEEIGFKK